MTSIEEIRQFLPTFLFVTGAVVVLYFRNHTLGIALGIWSILFIWFQIALARWRQPVRAARAEADTRITATLADSISNHANVSLFSGLLFEVGIFHLIGNSP